jgi:hypothetical protein
VDFKPVADFDLGTARAMAWMSQLAYECAHSDKIAKICEAWGLRRPRIIASALATRLPLLQTRGIVAEGHGATILAFAGTDPMVQTAVGTFNGLPTSGSTFTVGGIQFSINYTGGDGNDVVLTALNGAAATLSSVLLNGGSAYINNPSFSIQHSMVGSHLQLRARSLSPRATSPSPASTARRRCRRSTRRKCR